MCKTFCTGEDEVQSCKDGDLKLVGGGSNEEGVLKICQQEVWGTICNFNWDPDVDTTVACRQLGFQRTGQSMIAIITMQ